MIWSFQINGGRGEAATVATVLAGAAVARRSPRSRSPRSRGRARRASASGHAEGPSSCASTLTVSTRITSSWSRIRRSISCTAGGGRVGADEGVVALAVLVDLVGHRLEAPVFVPTTLPPLSARTGPEMFDQRLGLRVGQVLARDEDMLVKRHALSCLACALHREGARLPRPSHERLRRFQGLRGRMGPYTDRAPARKGTPVTRSEASGSFLIRQRRVLATRDPCRPAVTVPPQAPVRTGPKKSAGTRGSLP